MFFSRKSKRVVKCERCNKKINEAFNFCPYCGNDLIDPEEEMKDFGMLGKNDILEENIQEEFASANLGITDKLIGSLVNSLMKNLDKQFKELENTEIKNMPNGIKIRIGSTVSQPAKEPRTVRKIVTEDQIRRMTELPRSNAKARIRRLSDKVVYELKTPGLESAQDVFISKSESGFEIKAIGKNKVYVKNLPINLPLKGFSITDNKLLVEFRLHEDQ